MTPTPSIPEDRELDLAASSKGLMRVEPNNVSLEDDSPSSPSSPTFPVGEPTNSSSAASNYPPLHPVPSMQAAFEESMYEQGHPNPAERGTNPFQQKYHPLTKLISQITFGMHLLYNRLAKSDSEVVRILQSHVNDMDAFLSTTTRDFDLAKQDISARIRNLNVPLQPGEPSDMFEHMLQNDLIFRRQIVEGNKKVEAVVRRTARVVGKSLADVSEGLKAVDELAKYLLTLQDAKGGKSNGWRNANLERVYAAMTHNVEGWFRCFVGLQMKGQGLGERLNSLRLVVWEIDRRCGRASRGSLAPPGNGRNSLVIRKQPSLNQIPENPSAEQETALPPRPSTTPATSQKATAPQKAEPAEPPVEKELATTAPVNAQVPPPLIIRPVTDKPLPRTPIPTPVNIVPPNAPNSRMLSGITPLTISSASGHKRHSSLNDVLNSNPRHNTLVKRRSSVAAVPGSSTARNGAVPAAPSQTRTVETIVVLDQDSGNLRRKRIHRRSATFHNVPTQKQQTATEEFDSVLRQVGGKGNKANKAEVKTKEQSVGVLSSLRRSLSLGRSGSRGKAIKGGASGDADSMRGGSSGKATGDLPPVPQIPSHVQKELAKMGHKQGTQGNNNAVATSSADAAAPVVPARTSSTNAPGGPANIPSVMPPQQDHQPRHRSSASALAHAFATTLKKRKSKSRLSNAAEVQKAKSMGSLRSPVSPASDVVPPLPQPSSPRAPPRTPQELPVPGKVRRTSTAPIAPTRTSSAAYLAPGSPRSPVSPARSPRDWPRSPLSPARSTQDSPRSPRPPYVSEDEQVYQTAPTTPTTPTTPKLRSRRSTLRQSIGNMMVATRPRTSTGTDSGRVEPESVPPVPSTLATVPVSGSVILKALGEKERNRERVPGSPKPTDLEKAIVRERERENQLIRAREKVAREASLRRRSATLGATPVVVRSPSFRLQGAMAPVSSGEPSRARVAPVSSIVKETAPPRLARPPAPAHPASAPIPTPAPAAPSTTSSAHSSVTAKLLERGHRKFGSVHVGNSHASSSSNSNAHQNSSNHGAGHGGSSGGGKGFFLVKFFTDRSF